MLRLAAQLGADLAGTATSFPSDLLGQAAVLTNADVYEAMRGPDAEATLAASGWRLEHPREAWGVERREWVRRASSDVAWESVGVSELAALAAERALGDAGLQARQVDLLIAATSTPSRITSTLAAETGHRTGITAPCMDVRAGGTGGLHAWLTAARFLSNECRTVLVVAAETPSLYFSRDDLATALLFGDGAAALLLRYAPGADSGLLGAVLERRDAPGRAFTVPGSLPPRADELDAGRYQFQKPDAAYRGAIAESWSALCEELRTAFPAEVRSADHFVPYAVTATQIRDAAAALGIAPERTFDTLSRHGCLGCAGTLAALDGLRRATRTRSGQIVALAAVAGGLSLAGMLWRL